MAIVSNECLLQIENDLGQSCPQLETGTSVKRFGRKGKCWAVGSSWLFNSSEYSRVWYGRWDDGSKYEWKSWTDGGSEDNSKTFKKREREAAEELRRKEDEAKLQKQKECREEWYKTFNEAAKSGEPHPYLVNKGIYNNFGAKILKNMLLIPVYDFDSFHGVQVITKSSKKFATGLKISGSFCTIGNTESPDAIYFSEGFATAATIHITTNSMSICCFTAGNLIKVIRSFRDKFKTTPFIICADNDCHKSKTKNPGIDAAVSIVDSVPNCSFVYPIFQDDKGKLTDFNDLHCIEGLDEVKKQISGKNKKKIVGEYWSKHIDDGFTFHDPIKDKSVRKVYLIRDFFDYKLNYITDHITREVYGYNNGYYSKIQDSQIESFAQKYYSNPVLTKDHEAKEFLKMVKRFHLVDIEDLKNKNANNGLINFKNSAYNYIEKKLVPHSPKHYFFHQIPHEFNPKKRLELGAWSELLRNITIDRDSLQLALCQFAGYCLSGMSYDFNNILILKGSGSNGKSTFINVLQLLLGSENCSNIQCSDIPQNRFLAADLEHKLANFSEEENPKKVFAETSVIKRISGNSPIRIEQKGIAGRSMINRAKLVLSYNEMPYLGDMSQGIKRRLSIIPFDLNLEKNPDKKIDNLMKKIESNIHEVIWWALLGLDSLIQSKGFLKLDETKDEVNEMARQSDPIIEWFDDCVKLTESHYDIVSTLEMFEHFIDSCAILPNEGYTLSKFTRRVRGILVEKGLNFASFKTVTRYKVRQRQALKGVKLQ